MKRKKNLEKKKCKIENINNFSLRLKIEMIIFITSYQMYYTDFYYISSTGDIEHKVNWGFISRGCINFGEPQLFHIRILNIQRFLIFV